MKLNKFKIIVLLIVFNYTSAFTQEFAPMGATWNFPETFAWSGDQNIISFHSLGDSIIDNKSYRIIEKDKWSCLLRFSGRQLIHQQNDSIFHLNTETNKLNLIIDFGALAGDNWFITKYTDSEFYDGMQCYVDSIGSTTLNNQELKLQYVTLKAVMNGEVIETDPINTVIIENIGFETALFPASFQGLCDGNYEGKLRCYEDSTLGLLNFSSEECLMTPTIEIDENENQIRIYPIPIQTNFTIETENNTPPKSVQLFELSGREVQSQFNSNTIEVSTLNNGIYIVRVELENRIVIRKIVIAH